MILMIDGEECPVEWEENESVEALKELCPLTVKMSMYGGTQEELAEMLGNGDVEITLE